MANTSYRLGKKMKPDEIKAALADNPEMLDSFNRMLEHLAANEVDLEKEPITMGPMLTMDPAERAVCRRVRRHGQHVPEAQLPRAVRGAGERLTSGIGCRLPS